MCLLYVYLTLQWLSEVERVMAEKKILATLSHPFLVRYLLCGNSALHFQCGG